MAVVGTQTEVKPPGVRARFSELTKEVQRGFVAEWAVTIVLLLFGTTTLIQAFVIPSASMVGTLLIGDHVLVDKLVYAPPGAVSGHLLPYREVRRGDVIVFRYPLNISQDYVKRAIGVPGDRIKLVNRQLMLNGVLKDEPYAIHSQPYMDPTGTTSRQGRRICRYARGPPRCWRSTWSTENWWCRQGMSLRWAITATNPTTAVIGAWCRGRTSWERRW